MILEREALASKPSGHRRREYVTPILLKGVPHYCIWNIFRILRLYITMKMKKVIACVAAAALAASCLSISAFAEGENDTSLDLEPPVTTVADVDTDTTDGAADDQTDSTDNDTAADAVTTTTVTTTAQGNPKTGQSAYALAAIPVALGAVALIVAKKKKG